MRRIKTWYEVTYKVPGEKKYIQRRLDTKKKALNLLKSKEECDLWLIIQVMWFRDTYLKPSMDLEVTTRSCYFLNGEKIQNEFPELGGGRIVLRGYHRKFKGK